MNAVGSRAISVQVLAATVAFEPRTRVPSAGAVVQLIVVSDHVVVVPYAVPPSTLASVA